MPQTGKNKGNRHASLPEGQRKRVQFSISLSGERLNRLAAYLQATGFQEEITDEQIAASGRQMLEEWVDQLVL